MSDERDVLALLGPLRAPTSATTDAAVLTARAHQLAPRLAAIAVEAAQRAERRRWMRWATFAGGATAVACAAAALLVLLPSLTPALDVRPLELLVLDGELTVEGGPNTGSAGVRGQWKRGQHGALADSISTEAQPAAAELGDGLRVELAARSRLSVDEHADRVHRVSLKQGSARFVVRRFEAGTFSVLTPDVRVVVHGTVFTVTVSAGRSCVRVEEGLVAVLGSGVEHRLGPHASYGCDEALGASSSSGAPSASGASSSSAAPKPVDPLDAAVAAALAGTEPPVSGAGTAPTAGSRRSVPLEADNRLLKEALLAERAGQREVAAQKLRVLLARSPQSPLSPVAARVLARVSTTRGAPGTLPSVDGARP